MVSSCLGGWCGDSVKLFECQIHIQKSYAEVGDGDEDFEFLFVFVSPPQAIMLSIVSTCGGNCDLHVLY